MAPDRVSDSDVRTGSRVRIEGLKARPELNGTLGTVTGINDDTGRWNVLVDDMREPLALKLEALSVAEGFEQLLVGTRVRIATLDKRPELNGKVGTIESFQGERITVFVDAIREKVALKPEALAVADEAPTSAAADSGEKQVRVECDGVTFKLTLTAQQLKKPLADAVLRPFLKAYSKKKGLGEEVDVKKVAQVTLDSDAHTSLQVLTDMHIFPTGETLKGCRGDIDIEIFLKQDKPPPQPEAPKPAAAELQRLPKDARVMIHGLTSAAGQALNGEEGRLEGFREDRGRYDVRLTDGRVVSTRMENVMDLGPKDPFGL